MPHSASKMHAQNYKNWKRFGKFQYAACDGQRFRKEGSYDIFRNDEPGSFRNTRHDYTSLQGEEYTRWHYNICLENDHIPKMQTNSLSMRDETNMNMRS